MDLCNLYVLMLIDNSLSLILYNTNYLPVLVLNKKYKYEPAIQYDYDNLSPRHHTIPSSLKPRSLARLLTTVF